MKTPEELCKKWCKENLDIATHAYCYGAVNLSFLAGYQAAAPQWISVKDKSPEINQRVLLATNEKRSIVTGYRLPPAGKNEPWFHTDLGLWCGTETVTHWMPLPKPPEEI
jgi:hypothetical protein